MGDSSESTQGRGGVGRRGGMAAEERDMRQVVARLRETEAEALLELAELRTAVNEILSCAVRLAGSVREIAGESAALASAPSAATATRRANLATYARTVSSGVDSQAIALRELQRGLEGWDIQCGSP
jgi:hypothetical protein